MDLVTPSLGLVFWSSVSFLILFLILRKFAWKQILQAIHEREASIEEALGKAEQAKQEMARLNSENEELLKVARAEREVILKEAKALKEQILSDAREKAREEGVRIIDSARIEIETQKNIALSEVKTQVVTLTIEISEKLLRKQLQDKSVQEALILDWLKELKQ